MLKENILLELFLIYKILSFSLKCPIAKINMESDWGLSFVYTWGNHYLERNNSSCGCLFSCILDSIGNHIEQQSRVTEEWMTSQIGHRTLWLRLLKKAEDLPKIFLCLHVSFILARVAVSSQAKWKYLSWQKYSILWPLIHQEENSQYLLWLNQITKHYVSLLSHKENRHAFTKYLSLPIYSNKIEKTFYPPNKYTCFMKADTECSDNTPYQHWNTPCNHHSSKRSWKSYPI